MRVKGPMPPVAPRIEPYYSSPSLPAIQYSVLKSAAMLEQEVLKSAAPVAAIAETNGEMNQAEYGLYALSLIAQMIACLRSKQMDKWTALKKELDRIRPLCDSTMQQMTGNTTAIPSLSNVKVWLKAHKDDILSALSNEQRSADACMNFFWFLAEGMNSKEPNAFFTEWIDSAGGGSSNLIEIMPKFVIAYYHEKYLPQDLEGFKKQVGMFCESLPENYSNKVFTAARTQLTNDLNAISRGETLPWLDEAQGGLTPADYINHGLSVFAQYIDRK